MLILPMGWLPWVLVAYMRAVRRGSWFAGIPAGAALALMLIAGHPQITLIAALTVMFIWAFEAFRPTPSVESPYNAFWQATRPLITLIISSITLSLVASLPVLATVVDSERANSVDLLKFADSFSLPANQLYTFVFPTLAGTGRETWADQNFEELFAYSGLLALIGLPILLQRAQRRIWLLLFLAGFGILMAMALDGGILRLLIHALPFLSIFRSNGRWLMITGIALACAAGLFVTQLQKDRPEERILYLNPLTHGWLPRLIFGLFAASFLLSMGRAVSDEVVNPQDWWHAAEVVAGTALMLLLLTLALIAIQQSTSQRALFILMVIALLDVWRVTMPLLNVSNQSPYAPIWRRIERVIPPDEAEPYRLVLDQRDYRSFNGATGRGYYDIYGYEPLPSDTYNKWTALSNDPQAFTNRLLGIRYFVKSEPLPDSEEGNVTLIYQRPESKVFIYEIDHPLDRAFFATRVIEVEATSEFGEQYIQVNQAGDPTLVLMTAPPACDTTNAAGTVDITQYRANRVHLEVNSETGGLLVLTDRYATGWKAAVNGERTEIYRANTIFRAVCVPAGTSEVIFQYSPDSLLIGLLVSVIGWIGVGVLGIAHLRYPGRF